MLNIDSIIFDLDGTLWEPTSVVLKAWNEVLKERKDVDKPITKEQMESTMGLQLPQIGEKLFPKLDSETQMELMRSCCSIERDLIRREGGILYPNLEETLIKLSNKYPLSIVSNCQCGYIEAFFAYHKLEKLFIDFESAENTGFSKGENIKLVMQRNGLKNPIYVGDTQGDCDAAKIAGVPFVYAGYGFGKVTEYDYRIESIEQLTGLVL
jgi:phosphoglycolate phosphatase